MSNSICIAALLATALQVGSGVDVEPARNSERTPPVNTATPVDAQRRALEPLLQLAVADLSRRLTVDLADIQVIEARATVWPDSSFGCPVPGLNYLQVQREGAFIKLRANGRDFDYHSGGGRPPFLCEKRR